MYFEQDRQGNPKSKGKHRSDSLYTVPFEISFSHQVTEKSGDILNAIYSLCFTCYTPWESVLIQSSVDDVFYKARCKV